MAGGPSGFKLKLNTGTSAGSSQASPPAATPTAATPGGSKPKFLFVNKKSSVPPTPAPVQTPKAVDEKPKKSKAGRASKPTPKLLESRKRTKDESDEEEENSSTINVEGRPSSKKIKLNTSASILKPHTPHTPHTPLGAVVIKSKHKGKPPQRIIGSGYDSEASDREIDPAREDQFILRMMPGDDCDYLRQAITDRKIGIPKQQGGADVYLKFFHGDGRRACVNIRGTSYAATLVDLPCIVEGMKSWDKRGWWKSADICQMLWVYAKINTDSDAKTTPLPSTINHQTFQYPHGLTPPMHFARKRRFRKRIHKSEIEAVEAEVDRLLKADENAISSSYVIIDPEAEERRASQAWSPEGSQALDQYSQDEDAEGEADDGGYFGNMQEQAQLSHNTQVNAGVKMEPFSEDEMEAELMAAFETEANDNQTEAQTPISTPVATPSQVAVSTPAEADEALFGDEDSGDESFESDDEDAADEEDPAEAAKKAFVEQVREIIASLEQQREHAKNNLLTTTNPLLRRRAEETIKKLTLEINLKQSSLEEGDD